MTIVPMSGHSWDTYSQIEETGLLKDVESQPWDGPGKCPVNSPVHGSPCPETLTDHTLGPFVQYQTFTSYPTSLSA